MKAKEWYNKLKECKEEDFEKVFENCLKSLVDDADRLIKIRRATSDKAVASCLDEVNNKWIAICNLHENATYNENHPLYNVKLLKDGFKAAYVQIHPNKGWYFDIKQHRTYVANEQDKMAECQFFNPTIKLFGLTPYEELTLEGLPKEILENLFIIGKYSSDPTRSIILLRILAHRVRLLKYWHANNNINLDDVTEMEKDPYKFFEERNIPV